MRRDIGNEVVVAIVAVLILAFALIFGVVLTLSNNASGGVALLPTSTLNAGSVNTAAASADMDRTALSQTLQVGTEVVRLLTASAVAQSIPSRTETATPDQAAIETATAARVPIDQTLQVGTEVVRLLTASAQAQNPTAAVTATELTVQDTATEAQQTFVPATWTSEPTSAVSDSATPELTRQVADTATSDTIRVPADTATPAVQDLVLEFAMTATYLAQNVPGTEIASAVTESPTSAPSAETATVEPSPTAFTATQTASDEPSNTPSATVAPTDTDRPTATATRTPVPSETPTPSMTPSLTPTTEPSNTPTATRTATDVPSSTPTATRTASPAPSLTPSQTPSFTASPTVTSTVTATSTVTPTVTRSATQAPSSTPTVTPSSTATHTITPSVTPSATVTSTPTATSTPIIPTALSLPDSSGIPTIAVTPQFLCSLPFGWTTYLVQAGDTLYAIALASASSIAELRNANCLANISTLPVGLPLYVPLPVTVPLATVPVVQPSVTPVAGASQGALDVEAQGCTSADAIITSPVTGQVVSSVVTIFGSAGGTGFGRFELGVRADSERAYSLYDSKLTPVGRSALGQVNPAFFGEGIHWIRVASYDASGQLIAACAIPVIFR